MILQETIDYIRREGVGNIDFGIILGSGLGAVARVFDIVHEIHYSDIPHMVNTSVRSHGGVLLVVRAGNRSGVIFSGRLHYYEGHSMAQVAYPVRILKALGGRMLITTGAAGGLDPHFKAGDLVAIEDHISLMPDNPLRGQYEPGMGPRFPDMSDAYSERLLKIYGDTNDDQPFLKGTYAGVPGPSLETKAEYEYLHRIGADLVGMSIVPEVIVAAQCGLETLGVVVVSNICYPPENVTVTTIEAVLEVVNTAGGKLANVLHEIVMNDNL